MITHYLIMPRFNGGLNNIIGLLNKVKCSVRNCSADGLNDSSISCFKDSVIWNEN